MRLPKTFYGFNTTQKQTLKELADLVGLLQLRQTNTGFWRYETSTVMADPGSGDIRSNAATAAASTAIAVSTHTNDNIDARIILLTLQSGDILYMQETDNVDNWARFSITGSVIDNTTWFEIPIVFVTGAGSLTKNNTELLLRAVYG